MQLRTMPLLQLMRTVAQKQYDAALTQFASTRSLSFVYTFWHSPAPDLRVAFPGTYSGADAALDRLRAALTVDEIRAAVPRVQQAFVDDPPAVILDWLETSRAVRSRIDVPAEPGRDILGSISRWRPTPPRHASR
jgi:hypothetical protein